MALKAGFSDYKKAYHRHCETINSMNLSKENAIGDINEYSWSLILIYCVECGLKSLIMKKWRIATISEISEDDKIKQGLIKSHDILKLLKYLNQPGGYEFKSFPTKYKQSVSCSNYHEFRRYSIAYDTEKYSCIVKQYDINLLNIMKWIGEKL